MIEVIRNLNGLCDLADEWNQLPGACQNPLLRHEWFLSSAEAFHDEADLCVVTLRENGRLRAVAPLALVRRHGIQRLELLGASALHEPSDLLYDDNDSLSELCAAITRQPQATVLQRLAESSAPINRFPEQARGRGKLVKLSATSAPYVVIQSSWDQYFDSLSSRRRYDFRRARTRLERTGKVSVEFINPSEADLDHLMQDNIRIESSGWKGRAGSALKYNQSLQRFMRAYALRACRLGMLRLCYLKVGNETIAMQIAIEYAGRYWVLKIGYDERWAEYSPGMQLTMEAVKYAFNTGLKSYEFLGSDEPWLRVWTQQSSRYSTLLYFPYTIGGLSALGADVIVHFAKRVAGLVPRKRLGV